MPAKKKIKKRAKTPKSRKKPVNNVGPTLKQRQAAGGTQAQRRRARFAAQKVTDPNDPRFGLTHNTNIRRDELRGPKSRLGHVADAIATPRKRKR